MGFGSSCVHTIDIHRRILETAHSVFLLRQIWFCAIMGFGNYVAVGGIEWYVFVQEIHRKIITNVHI